MAHCRLCGTPNSDGTVYCAGESCGADQPGLRATSGDLAVQAWFEPSTVTAPPGARVEADLVVRNAGRVPDRYEPLVLDDGHGDVVVQPHPHTTPLAPGQQRRWSVTWTVPAFDPVGETTSLLAPPAVAAAAQAADRMRTVVRVASRQDERAAAAASFAVQVPGGPDGPGGPGRAGARIPPAVAAVVAAAVLVALVVGIAGARSSDSGTVAAPAPPRVPATAAPADEPAAAAVPPPGADTPVVDVTGPRRSAVPGGAAASPSPSGRTGIAVPDVVGLTESQARARLDAAGLTYSAAPAAPGLVAAGEPTVAAQEPVAGNVWYPGDPALTLTLRAGPPAGSPVTVAVPAVTRLTYDEARKRVEAAGLRVARTTAFDAAVPAGSVSRSEPAAGAQVASGSTVTLVVSNAVTVPVVTGLEASAAQAKLASAGLTMTVDGAGDPASRDWIVATQTPSSGRVAPGSTVRVTLVSALR